jgi:hypothetical protein
MSLADRSDDKQEQRRSISDSGIALQRLSWQQLRQFPLNFSFIVIV